MNKYKIAGESRIIIIVVVFTALVTTISGSAFNLAIPAIGAEFGDSATALGWMITAYMISVVTLTVPFGRIADITDRRKILILGIIVFSVFCAITIFAHSLLVVIIFRIFQGVGAAMMFSTNTAILVNAFPSDVRGKVLGYNVAATYIGLSVGPFFGGILTHYFGWRSIFIVSALIGVASLMITVTKLPKLKRAAIRKTVNGFGVIEKRRLDVFGMLLYIMTLLFIMCGFAEVVAIPYAYAIIAVGILLFVLFIRHELDVDSPIIEIQLFRHNLNYLFSNIAALFNYGATFAVSYLVSIYLQLIMEFDASVAGSILICQPVVQAILSPFAGRFSDRISPYILASLGMGLCTLSLISFTFLDVDSPLALIIINLIIVGIGFGLFSSPNTNAIMSSVPPTDYSVASSVLASMRLIGHVSSMAIITFVMNARLGKMTFAEAPPARLIDMMHVAFIVFSIICLVGVFISLQRKTIK